MSRFTTHRTSTGREISVRPNHSKRHFTIKCSSGIWRTYSMTKEEFQDALHRTGNDWNDFLKSNDYFKA